MASTVCVDAEEASSDLNNVTGFESQLSVYSDDDDLYSLPPSPEIGMARDEGVRVEDLGLEVEVEDDAADASSLIPRDTHEKQGIDIQHQRRLNSPSGRPQVQRPPTTNARSSPSDSTDPQPTNVYATCPPVRRSARAKGTLIYDQKYHPMDDVIRPSQAAKRRSLHGESPMLYDGSENEVSESFGSGEDSTVDTEDDDGDSQPPSRARKRKRSLSGTPEPTRRSSRRRTKPKISYDMKIHPQDSDLKRSCAYDGSNSSPLPAKQTRCRTAESRSIKDPTHLDQRSLLVVTSDDPASAEPSIESSAQELPNKECASERPQKVGDIYPDLHPDVAYLNGSWPEIKGLPFCVYTDRMEDQLNAEAELASPFHYEDDDKENDVVNPELAPQPNPLDGISIIPASYYRRSPGFHPIPPQNSIASNAFYSSPHESSPYGLGWSDSERDASNNETRDCPLPDYMRILVSSENLPRSFTSPDSRPYGNDITVSSSPLRTVTGFDLRR